MGWTFELGDEVAHQGTVTRSIVIGRRMTEKYRNSRRETPTVIEEVRVLTVDSRESDFTRFPEEWHSVGHLRKVASTSLPPRFGSLDEAQAWLDEHENSAFLPEPDASDNICNQCDLLFQTPDMLRAHQEVHT